VAAQAVDRLGDHEGGVAGQAQGEGVDALDLLNALEEGGGVPAGVVGLDDLGGELRVGAVAQGAVDDGTAAARARPGTTPAGAGANPGARADS